MCGQLEHFGKYTSSESDARELREAIESFLYVQTERGIGDDVTPPGVAP